MSDVLINPARVRRVKPLSAEEVVSAVERALLTEVRLTPKPGKPTGSIKKWTVSLTLRSRR